MFPYLGMLVKGAPRSDLVRVAPQFILLNLIRLNRGSLDEIDPLARQSRKRRPARGIFQAGSRIQNFFCQPNARLQIRTSLLTPPSGRVQSESRS
jgi:hypothetical protein